jgi:predicted negative regulator of RcsB-dependent stress response
MAEQSAFDRKNIQLQTLSPPMGLLEQFNLPPAAITFIRRNQRAIWMAVAGCVFLIVAVSAYTSYRHYRDGKAASALDVALVAKQDSRQMLEKVVQEYGSTPSGLWAKIELAFLDEKEGQRPKAITGLEAINAGLAVQSLLKPLVLGKLAALNEDEKQFDKALVYYSELAGKEGFAPEAYRAMGRVNEQLGKSAEAVAMYGKYLELTPFQGRQQKNDPVREMVQARINQLKK